MKDWGFVFLAVLMVFVCGCSDKPKLGKWKRYEAHDGSFAIKMPGKCNKISENIPIEEGAIKIRMFECVNQDAVFTAGIFFYPQEFLTKIKRENKNLFLLARDATIKQMNAKLLDSRAGKVKKFYGTYSTRTFEWEVVPREHPDVKVYLRQYLIFSPKNRKMYMHQVSIPLEDREKYQKAITKLRRSFEFHDE
ncbi:MAG: hypothetical protein ACYTET_07780 [Planctomycetota bacterium]|jgi:hypothetical protein